VPFLRSEDLEATLTDISVPFLALHGTADSVVDIQSSRLLVERARSEDKRLREVPNALHSLLCELPDVRADVLHYITEWLEPRAAKAAARARALAEGRLAPGIASPRKSE
jgi:alpha-beta hydrolase superfamily lysophospholipase